MKKIEEHASGVDFYLSPSLRLTSLFEGRGICAISPGNATTGDISETGGGDFDNDF